MARTLLALVLVAGLATAAMAAQKDAAGTKDAPDAKAKTDGNGKWFSSPNPFAPLSVPETPKEKPAPAEKAAPELEAGRVIVQPFTLLQPPAPVVAAPTAAPALPKLNGILASRGLVMAIVDDTIVKVGDEVAGMKVKSIATDTVIAEKEGTRYVMTTRRPLAQAQVDPQAPKTATVEPPTPAPAGETGSSDPEKNADKKSVSVTEKAAIAVSPAGVNCPDPGVRK